MHVLRLCSVYESPPGPADTTRGFDAIGGLQVHAARLTAGLDAHGVEQTVVTAYRPGAPRLESAGASSSVVRVGVPLRRFRQLYGLAAVPRVARLRDVDLVHVHLGEDLAVAPLARWASARFRASLVATVHCSLRHTLVGHDLRSRTLRSLGARRESAILRASSAVLVLSDRLADRLTAAGLARTHLRVVPIGIDLDAFARSVPRPEVMDGRRWVVSAGRLVPEKGVGDLIQAFARISDGDAGLLVVGDGPERATLGALVRDLRIEHRVRFVGAVPNRAVAAYLQHADVVVLPSWYEERGRVLLEAMAAGAPVVASRTGGIPATVRDGKNGLLVPVRDPRRLAEAIDRILHDPTLAASLREAGRATAADHGVPALVEAVLDAYHLALHDVPVLERVSAQ